MTNVSGPSLNYQSSGNNPEIVWGYPPGISIIHFVPEDMKHLIHSHWNKFPPVNPMWHYLLGVVFTVIGISAVIGRLLFQLIHSETKFLNNY